MNERFDTYEHFYLPAICLVVWFGIWLAEYLAMDMQTFKIIFSSCFTINRFAASIRGLLLLLSFLTLAQRSYAFSVSDHRFVSRLAIDNLIHCRILPEDFSKVNKQYVIDGNLEQDSLAYLPSKWFRYSHFYNPILPIKSVGPMVSRAHSEDAVAHYSERILKRVQMGASKAEVYQDLGAIMHHLQDTSSPLHVMAINHGTSDGFEAKLNVQSTLTIEDLGCPGISTGEPLEPYHLQKLAGLKTLARVDQDFGYFENGTLKTAKWNQAFFVNKTLTSPVVSEVLQNFIRAQDKQSFLFLALPPELKGKLLSSGRYGAFNGTARRDLGLNNFSKEHFEIKNGNGAEGSSQYYVPKPEYVKIKRDLLIQAIETSQNLLIWMHSL